MTVLHLETMWSNQIAVHTCPMLMLESDIISVSYMKRIKYRLAFCGCNVYGKIIPAIMVYSKDSNWLVREIQRFIPWIFSFPSVM